MRLNLAFVAPLFMTVMIHGTPVMAQITDVTFNSSTSTRSDIATACAVFARNAIPLSARAKEVCEGTLAVRRPDAISAAGEARQGPVGANSSRPGSMPTVLGNANGTSGAPFLMLRQDQYDQVSFALSAQSWQVLQGSSISYQKDQTANTQSATIQTLIGYSAYNWASPLSQASCGGGPGDPFLARFGYGPFVLADGTYNQPTNANEKSALRVGLGGDFQVCNGPIFPIQTVQIMPYAQTDFRGKASIAGFDALWEPFNPSPGIFLGGRTNVYDEKDLMGYYVRVLAEANIFEVKNSGLTNFSSNRAYALIGGTAELRAILFENNPHVPAALCGKISIIGTARYLWDAVSQQPISLLGGQVAYKLSGQPDPSTVYCQGSSPEAVAALKAGGSSAPLGSASIALTYNQGTDPATFVKQNIYKVSFKLSY